MPAPNAPAPNAAAAAPAPPPPGREENGAVQREPTDGQQENQPEAGSRDGAATTAEEQTPAAATIEELRSATSQQPAQAPGQVQVLFLLILFDCSVSELNVYVLVAYGRPDCRCTLHATTVHVPSTTNVRLPSYA